MNQKRILLGLGLVAVIAIVITVGMTILSGENGNQTATTNNVAPRNAIATVNGEAITQDELDVEFTSLLNVYRPVYEESGNNIDDFLNGQDGGYNRLQIEFQALGRIINKTVAEQRLEEANLLPTEADVDTAFDAAYSEFLSQLENSEFEGVEPGELEQLFAAVFEDPERLPLAQELLGFRENSLDALKARMRAEAEANLRFENLWRIAFGSTLPADQSEEFVVNRISSWIDNEVAVSDITYHDPLLEAHALEVQVNYMESLDARSDMLAAAIEKYEELAQSDLETDVDLERKLNRLYDLKVNWDLQLERELIAEAQDNIDAQRELEEKQEEILINRRKASQSLAPEDTQNEDLLRIKLQTDNNNPLYYYLLAKLLIEDWEENSIREIRNLIFGALSRDDEYIDALALNGDLDMIETKYLMAIENYEKAFNLYDEVAADPENAFKIQDHSKDNIKRKLAESLIGRAGQLDTMSEPPADAAEQRSAALARARGYLSELLDALIEEDPDYPLTLIAMADLEVLSENLTVARDLYIESLEHIEDIDVMIKLGNVYIDLANYADARSTFEEVLEINGFEAKAHLGLAHIFRAEGNIEQALIKYEDAFKFGVDLDYLDRYAIAQEALELQPDNISMRLRFADFLAEGNVHTAALREYGMVLDQDQSMRSAFLGLGKVHSKKLEYEEAIQSFRSAEGLSESLQEELETYELLYAAERGLAGPGKPMLESGQEVLYRLAILYLQDGQLVNSFNMLSELSRRYPDFKHDEVYELQRQLTQTAGDSLPGAAVANLGNIRVAPGESHGEYNSTPPTSGWNYAVPAAWGIHANPIQHELQVRNLALGGILLQYNPDTIQPEDLDSLTSLVTSMRQNSSAYCQVLLAPYSQAETSIVLTAWNRINPLETFDHGKIVSFIDAFIDRAPSAGEVPCSTTQDSTGL